MASAVLSFGAMLPGCYGRRGSRALARAYGPFGLEAPGIVGFCFWCYNGVESDYTANDMAVTALYWTA